MRCFVIYVTLRCIFTWIDHHNVEILVGDFLSSDLESNEFSLPKRLIGEI